MVKMLKTTNNIVYTATGEASSERLIPQVFRDAVKQIVFPASCHDLLFSNRPFQSFQEGIIFFSAYVFLLEIAGFTVVRPLHQFSARTRTIHGHPETRALAIWFKDRFEERISLLLNDAVQPLIDCGLDSADIAETMLHAGMQMECLTLPQEDSEQTEDEKNDENDGLIDNEAIRLVCDSRMDRGSVMFLLKQLQPHGYGVLLKALKIVDASSVTYPMVRPFLNWNSDVSDEWHRARKDWLHYFFWLGKQIPEDTASKNKSGFVLLDELKRRIRPLPYGIEFDVAIKSEFVRCRIDCEK